MNFFEVKIGKSTKRGGMVVSHSFVCKTEMTQSKLWNEMLNRYKGFDVNIFQVENVEEIEPNTVVEAPQHERYDSPNPTKTITYLEVKVPSEHLSLELKTEWSQLNKSFRDLEETQSKLLRKIDDYCEMKIKSIGTIPGIKNRETWRADGHVMFKVALKGTCEETIQEIIQKDNGTQSTID
jgi:hypothetical protein